MKCALVFLSVLALGCALPLLQEASIHIAVATDGTISIYGTSGNKLVISRVWEHAGQKNVEVFAGIEHGTVKKIMVDHDTTLKHVDALYQTGLTEADVLVHIFKHHQGDVDVNTYTHLLEQVHSHAQSGHVRMALYNILKSFIAQEVNWNENTAAHMVNSVSPKWFSLLNHLGLETAGSRFTHETLSGMPLFHAANIRIIVADDATVTIHGASGHKLVISKVWQNSGKNNVEVLAGVEHGTVERILQDQESTLELVNAQYQTGMTEADVLVQIFRNYQGEVDVNAYTHLLRAVFAHVHTGHVRMAVYNILKTFIANEVGLDTSMTNYVTPKWYSLYNILESRQTGLESTQTFNKAEEFPSIHEASFHVAIANDDTISIHGASGNKLVVSKVLKHLGNKNVVVYLGVEHGEMNEILLDQESTMEHSYDEYHTDLTEADVLVQIFKHYQGDVDTYTYTNLLKQVYVQVQAGHVRMAVHNVLKNFFIHEINWARFVASGTHMGQHTAPEWQSLFNLENTESEYGSDFSTELRNNLGYSEHMQKVTPENYYGWNLNAFTRPIYQRVQQTKWLPQQQNTHNNFMNTPFVY